MVLFTLSSIGRNIKESEENSVLNGNALILSKFYCKWKYCKQTIKYPETVI